jgi:hypothetical protein
MSKLTPAERKLRAQIASNIGWAKTHDVAARTGPGLKAANEANWKRFENEVDPDRVLDPAERHRRADHARRAYMATLAFKAAKARRLKRGAA